MTDDGASARDPEAQLAHARLVARMLGDDEADGMQVGRFALLERIGAGGMGVVFVRPTAAGWTRPPLLSTA